MHRVGPQETFSSQPDPGYVSASLIEFVRKRVKAGERATPCTRSRADHRTLAKSSRRSSSAPAKQVKRALIPNRAELDHEQGRNSNPCPHRRDLNKSKQSVTKCPSCGTFLAVAKRSQGFSKCECHRQGRNNQSCPDIYQQSRRSRSGKSARNTSKRKSMPAYSKSMECIDEAAGDKSADLIKEYKFSIGFKVKHRVKTSKLETKDSGSVATRYSRQPKDETNEGARSHSKSQERSQTCGCQVNRPSPVRYCIPFDDLLELSDKIHGGREISNDLRQNTNVVLRRRNRFTTGKSRPRPLSDSALQPKGGALTHLYRFDIDFHPIKPLSASETSDSAMKTGLSKKPVRIHLLNNDSVLLVFESKSTVQQLFDQVCALLSIKEGQFFGLSALVDNEKLFMDLKQKITKYAPKDWGKELKRRASDLGAASSTVLTVQFQVQFYVEHPKLISDKNSRHQYYLQMKKNVLRSRVLTQDEVLFTLASHALQADMGDHNSTQHKQHYFNTEDYFPAWFIDKWGREYLISHLPALHAEHKGMTVFESQAQYIQQASGIDDVPVHYYKLYKNKKETKANVLLGIFHQGIRIHYGNPEKPQTPWKLEFEFMWNKVGRLFFTGKRFEIYPEDLPASRRLTYYTGSHSRSKYLLHFLRETHSLYMSLSPYAQHMRRADGRRLKRRYRESYISGKNLDLERCVDIAPSEQHSTDNEEEFNRTKQDKEKLFNSYYNSTTSHGSSHTSGIESDSKLRTEEEDEEDEIFVDDFDPVDIGHQRQFVNITEDHLTAPLSKSLSVNNLADPTLEDLKFTRLSTAEDSIPGLKSSNKPSRDSTLKGEDFCIVAEKSLVFDNNNVGLKDAKPFIANLEGDDSRDGTPKNVSNLEELMGVPYEYTTAPTLEKNKASSVTVKPKEKTAKTPESKKRIKKKVSDMSTQTLTPAQAGKSDAIRSSSQCDEDTKLYYSDIHTVPRSLYSGSGAQHAKQNGHVTKNESNVLHDESPRSRKQHSRQQRDKNAKRSSSAHGGSEHQPDSARRESHALRSRSKTASNHNQIPLTPRSDVTGHRHVVPIVPQAGMPHGNSVNCIPSSTFGAEFLNLNGPKRHSAFVPVTKPLRRTSSKEKGQAYYTIARGDPYGKNTHFDTKIKPGRLSEDVQIVTVGARDPVEERRHHSKGGHHRSHTADAKMDKRSRPHKPRSREKEERNRMSSYEDEVLPQKMSDVCLRTLSAQRRKLSDTRLNQRMDSGRSSLRTTDESSCGLDVGAHDNHGEYVADTPSPHTPSRRRDVQLDLLRTPFIENYKEVIV